MKTPNGVNCVDWLNGGLHHSVVMFVMGLRMANRATIGLEVILGLLTDLAWQVFGTLDSKNLISLRKNGEFIAVIFTSVM